MFMPVVEFTCKELSLQVDFFICACRPLLLCADNTCLNVFARGRPKFSIGFGTEIGKKFSFGLVLFSVGRATAIFGFGRNCQ